MTMPSSPPPSSRTVEATPASPAPAKGRGPWAAIVFGALALANKGKAALVVLKSLSFGKLLLSSLSMLAMVWVEAQRNGWLFGVGFVALILVHELGHGYSIRRHGLQAGWPVFLPFMGAFISMRGRPQTAAVEAEIAYAGPLAGTAASLAVASVYFVTH
jgi:hypothetical protein